MNRTELELVIAVRHGRYSPENGGLTPEGKSQIEFLADILKKIVPAGRKIKLLCSPKPRSIQSAEIIGKHLGLEYEVCEQLYNDDYDDSLIMEHLLKKHSDSDVIVAVTHSNFPSGIINAFSKRCFNKPATRKTIDNGNGCMINLKTGEVTMDLLTDR